MSTSSIDPPTKPSSHSDAKTVPASVVDQTMVAPANGPSETVVTGGPPAGTPPPAPPPPGGGPPPSGPPRGPDYSLPIMIGVFVLALVGIGLLGLGIYAVMRLNSNPAVVAGPATPTRLPLSTQVVVVIPTTTPAPSATDTPTTAPTASALPATATGAAPLTATATITSITPITSTQAGNLLTVVQGANVRSGPGTLYPVVGTIKAGDTAPVVGRDAFGGWFVITYKGGFGGQGWISSAASISAYNGDKSKLTVVAAPPPPSPAPTAAPQPGGGGNPNGGLVTGAHGVSGMLNLCSGKVTFAVGERVCFVEWIKNNTSQPVPYGILGVTAVRQGGGTQFQTSWSGQQAPRGVLGIDPGCTGPTDRCKGQWEDGMKLPSPGDYQLTLTVCFSDFPTCRGSNGDWEVLSGAIQITVQ